MLEMNKQRRVPGVLCSIAHADRSSFSLATTVLSTVTSSEKSFHLIVDIFCTRVLLERQYWSSVMVDLILSASADIYAIVQNRR